MTALVERLAEAIWNASRADEGSISATGANIVARAILPLVAAEVEAAVSALRAERDEARPSDDRRSERWAQAIWGSSWTPQDLGLPEVADCMALADLENVELRREAIGLREQRDDAQRARDREEDLRLSVAAEVWALREKVAKVEALATSFERWPSSPSLSVAAKHLRAALSDPTTPDQTGGEAVCAKDVGDPPEVCRCLLPRGHAGLHECKHKGRVL